MKMKVGTRVLLTVYLIVVITLCGFILATIAGFISGNNILDFARTLVDGSVLFKILYAVIAIVLIIVSFMLMFFGLGKAPVARTAQVAVFESGHVVITIKAIEELVERYVHQNKSIKGLRTNVVSHEDSLDINLEVSVLPDINIPEVTKELQSGLVGYIQDNTGIMVKEIKITVTGLKENSVRTS